MRNAMIFSALFAIVSMAALAARAADDDPAKPKHTVKQVMTKAHKGDVSLLKKIVGGEGTADDKKLLVELYEALALNEPPQGDAESWKEKTAVVVAAAKAVAADEEGSTEKLGKAVNCGACHEIHKPKPAE